MAYVLSSFMIVAKYFYSFRSRESWMDATDGPKLDSIYRLAYVRPWRIRAPDFLTIVIFDYLERIAIRVLDDEVGPVPLVGFDIPV